MRRIGMFGIILILAASVLPGCGGNDNPLEQPTRAEVSIAFDQDISNLARLEFKLNHTAGATFDGVPLSSLPVEIRIYSNYEVVNAANPGGINTGTASIMKLAYTVAGGAGQPTFSIDSSQGTFTAIAPDFGPTTPPITSDNLLLSVTYQ